VVYHVQLLRRAYADLDGLFAFISRSVNAASATKWRNGLMAKVDTLAQNPERYPLADDAADLGLELREMLYGRHRHIYRILFTIDGQTVNIHRVRHAAQDRLSPGDV
jgi:plasmid stabilization system protein ParE